MARSIRAVVVAAVLLPGLMMLAPGRAALPVTGPSRITVGVWWEVEQAGIAIPAPATTVPVNGLWVSSAPTGPLAFSAIRFQLKPNERAPLVMLNRTDLIIPPSTPLGTGQAPIVACPATSKWVATGITPGAWSARPTYDCTRNAVSPSISPNGGVFTFDLTTVTQPGQLVDLALVPGLVADAVVPIIPVGIPTPPLPPTLPGGFVIPNPLAAEQPATFSESFAPLTAASLDTVTDAPQPEVVTPAPAHSITPAPIVSAPVPAPVTDLPVTDTPVPVAAPASTRPQIALPQTAASPAAAVTKPASETGRRVLGTLLFLALCGWALELMIKDGNPSPRRREGAPPPIS